ncbi:MucBP domain-containing protein [Levilactobacillus angrenensis]|uniref:MucBP domain-containing protein n=1 Tax=Levilactobacillus angrenensis TaxID=2486020 RepID=A0ABW1U9X6_9LACO|nr:MucBP domain-containing protein [Levilactobacillus angrenensis]
MFNGMNTKEHYKMYKKGKAWVFASIVTATLALGVAGGQTAQADTTDTADSGQESTSSQSATPAKEVTLTQKTAEKTTETTTASDAMKTSEEANTEKDTPDAAKPSDPVTPATTPTTPVTSKTPTTPETPAVTTPVTKTDKTVKDVTDTTKKSVVKVTTAVTPDMRIKAPTRTKMMHTARAMAPATPTTQAPTVTPAVNAATPVTEADESIDQWMPNKILQKMVLDTFKLANTSSNPEIAASGKTWNSVNDITKEDMLLLNKLDIQARGTTYIDGKTSFSLEGLQYATNLTYLDLANSQDWAPHSMRGDITDLSPLKGLTKLTWLQFTGNRVSDITPITGLKNITSLTMNLNNVADFSSMNPNQYTDGYSIGEQFVENKVVYIPKTGTYTMINPVKAPQGSEFTSSVPGTAFALPITSVTYSDPTPTVRILWNGATSASVNGDHITYSGIRNQILPGQTYNPIAEQFPNLIQEDYTYFLNASFNDSNDGIVILLVTPYIQADEAQNVTVNYVDEAGNTLADSDTLTGLVGESYTAAPKEFKGYTLTATPANATGTFSDKAQTVTFVYKEATSTVTVHYQDEQGATIKPDDVQTGKVGDAYTIDHPAISGYTYKETVGEAAGDYAETPTEVTFIYTKDSTVTPPTNPEQTITVTVHYQTADGTQVAPDVVITGKTGDAYTTSPATNVLDGYELVSTPANATGTMGDSDITVTYLYTNTGDGDQVDPEPEKPTKPTKPTKPATDPDMVTPTKPTTPANQRPAQGGQADQVTTGQQTPAKGGAAATVDLAAKPDAKTANQPATSAKTTLPQTDEQSSSPLWGLALLGSLLGLVGFKRWKKN